MLAGNLGSRIALLADDGALYEDAISKKILEAGLITTYPRHFVEARRSGYPIIPQRIVPAEHRQLHDFLLARRSQHHAHTDASADPEHRRAVSGDGQWISVTEPDRLTVAQLHELADLTNKLQDNLRAALVQREPE